MGNGILSALPKLCLWNCGTCLDETGKERIYYNEEKAIASLAVLLLAAFVIVGASGYSASLPSFVGQSWEDVAKTLGVEGFICLENGGALPNVVGRSVEESREIFEIHGYSFTEYDAT